MARNANWDKAKLQAVGIYRKASPMASINHGVALYSGGDYRAPEGAKLYGSKPEPVDISQVPPHKIQRFGYAGDKGDRRKRANSCPQERAGMMAAGVRRAAPAMRAVVGWNSYSIGESALIKRG